MIKSDSLLEIPGKIVKQKETYTNNVYRITCILFLVNSAPETHYIASQ